MLEAIQVQEQHREHAPLLARLIDRPREVRLQVEPVREPGELVVVRQVIELLVALEELRLGLAAHGDVVHHHPEDLLPA